VNADNPLVMRMPVHWETYVNVVLAVVVFPIGVFLLVRGLDRHLFAAGITGAALCLLMLPLLILSGRELLLRPVLRTHTLRLPWGITGARHLQLADVSGVGMLYDAGGPRAEWVLWIWMSDGNSYSVESVRTFTRGHKEKGRPPAPPHIPKRRRPRLDWATVSRTRAGQAAIVIDRQARVVQGDSGPLRRMDQTGASFLGAYYAYWSPDGQMDWLPDDDQ
jgi:hypothetical protein